MQGNASNGGTGGRTHRQSVQNHDKSLLNYGRLPHSSVTYEYGPEKRPKSALYNQYNQQIHHEYDHAPPTIRETPAILGLSGDSIAHLSIDCEMNFCLDV